MKMKYILIFISVIVFFAECRDRVDPTVNTLFVEGKDRETLRSQAIPELFNHYVNSKKDKEAYEVISKKNGRFIINYTPSLGLLTLCGDPGSGWGNQFKNVDETVIESLVKGGYSFDDINDIGTLDSKYDSLLVKNRPYIDVKTNGSPSL